MTASIDTSNKEFKDNAAGADTLYLPVVYLPHGRMFVPLSQIVLRGPQFAAYVRLRIELFHFPVDTDADHYHRQALSVHMVAL